MDLSSVNYDQIFKRYDILVEAKEKPEDIAAKILPKDALLKKVAEDVVFMKYKDVEAMPDGHIDITLFNGAIRNTENDHMAHLLRKKSKLLVAYGACSYMGGIPGLADVLGRAPALGALVEPREKDIARAVRVLVQPPRVGRVQRSAPEIPPGG